MIAVIDYGAGNLQSVKKALDHIGCENIATANADEIAAADGIILPGVGSFGDAMEQLRSKGLDRVIENEVKKGKPLLGICLGLQLLFEESEESPNVKGLCLLKGKIQKIPKKEGIKVPHMGWNSLEITNKSGIFEDVNDGEFVYFVHSYYLTADNESDVSARTFYSVSIDAAVCHDNINAVQFHPEKSGECGLKMLRSFAKMVGGKE